MADVTTEQKATKHKKLKYQVVSRGVLNGEARIWETWVGTKAAALQVAREERARGWDVSIYKDTEHGLINVTSSMK